MMKTTSFFLVFTIFLFTSCRKDNHTDFILGSSTETIYLTDFIDSAKVVALSEDNRFRVGGISKIVKTGNCYIVLDHQRKTIIKFDYNGKPVCKINKVGRARNEYIDIVDFCRDEESGDIILLCNPMKLITLDSLFNVKDIKSIDRYCKRTFAYKGNIYLYSDVNRSLYVLDGDRTKTIVEEGGLPGMGFYPSCIFYKVGNTLLYSAVCSDHIYSIIDKTVQPFLDFSYKNKKQTIKKLREDRLFADWQEEEQYEYSPVELCNIFETNREYILIYSYQFLIRCCRFEKTTHKIVSDGILCTLSPLPIISNGMPVLAADFSYKGEQKLDSLLYNDSMLNLDSCEEERPTIIEYILK